MEGSSSQSIAQHFGECFDGGPFTQALDGRHEADAIASGEQRETRQGQRFQGIVPTCRGILYGAERQQLRGMRRCHNLRRVDDPDVF